MANTISFEEHHREFLSDPERAKAFLEVALEEFEQDGNLQFLQLAIQDVIKAQKKIAEV